jgi:hypothetical protein
MTSFDIHNFRWYSKNIMKVFKSFTASVLALSMFVATVACCCIGAGVMAHFHKPAMCCEKQNSSHQDSAPMGSCQNHLTSAEFSHAQAVLTAPAAISFFPAISLGTHHADFVASFPQVYSRGSPPLAASFTPLYLRTFNLRI